MKLKQILLLFFLFNKIINDRKVINSCGTDTIKTSNTMPTSKEDFKDEKGIYRNLLQ